MGSTSTGNEQIVRDVVNEFVSKQWSFTAFNITTEAKNRGANDRHLNLKGVVHAMFRDGDMDGYDRTRKDVGVSVQPYLYFHNSQDSNTVSVPLVATAQDSAQDSDSDGDQDNTPVTVSDGDGISLVSIDDLDKSLGC